MADEEENVADMMQVMIDVDNISEVGNLGTSGIQSRASVHTTQIHRSPPPLPLPTNPPRREHILGGGASPLRGRVVGLGLSQTPLPSTRDISCPPRMRPLVAGGGGRVLGGGVVERAGGVSGGLAGVGKGPMLGRAVVGLKCVTTTQMDDKSEMACAVNVVESPKSAQHNAANGKRAMSPALADDLTRDLTCPVCQELCLPPLMQCNNGHIVCNTCLKSPKLAKCPICRSNQIKVSRNLLMEQMAGKRKWKCMSSENGCSMMLAYSDIEPHTKKCKYLLCPGCPIGECAETLKMDTAQVLKHLKDKHKIEPEKWISEGDGNSSAASHYRDVVFLVSNYQKNKIRKTVVTERSKLFQDHNVFVLLTMIESEKYIQFKTLYFADEDMKGSIVMKKRFVKSGLLHDHVKSSERVQCLSKSVQVDAKLKKNQKLSQVKSLCNDDTMTIAKKCMSDSFFHHKSDGCELAFSIKTNIHTLCAASEHLA